MTKPTLEKMRTVIHSMILEHEAKGFELKPIEINREAYRFPTDALGCKLHRREVEIETRRQLERRTDIVTQRGVK